MTPQEAIEWLKAIEEKYIHGGDDGFDEKRKVAINNAVDALEKQIPKKVIFQSEFEGLRYCPCCKVRFIGWGMKYCGECGQALDWSDTE